MGFINNKNIQAMIIVGKTETKCIEKALEFLPNNPIVAYANEYDISDNFSIPPSRGILIKEANYKPNVDLIIQSISEYTGQIVLTSSNQKDVPKKLFNMLKLKRATGSDESLKGIAPRSNPPVDYGLDIFKLLFQFCKSSDREEVLKQLNLNLLPHQKSLFVTWLSNNMNTEKLLFIDSNVKYQWSNNYFNELLAYSFDGRLSGRVNMPKRSQKSEMPSICRKLKLRFEEQHLLDKLLEDDDFVKYAKTKLDNRQCRLLGLGEKRVRKEKKKKENITTLDRWL